MTPKIVLRDAVPEDVSFIFNSWLKSYRGSRAVAGIVSSVFFAEHHRVLERIMKSCKVIVACNPEDTSQIYGYIVHEMVSGVDVFHYAYVKHTFRRMGLAKAMLQHIKPDTSTASMYSHATPVGDKIAPKYHMVYSPYLALTPDYRENDKEIEVEE